MADSYEVPIYCQPVRPAGCRFAAGGGQPVVVRVDGGRRHERRRPAHPEIHARRIGYNSWSRAHGSARRDRRYYDRK